MIIRNARLRGLERVHDIAIKDGRIAKIGIVAEKGENEVDAGGRLVTESFVNPHLHMCKVYTFKQIGEESLRQYHEKSMGGAMTAIELAPKIKERYQADWIYENAKKAALEALNMDAPISGLSSTRIQRQGLRE